MATIDRAAKVLTENGNKYLKEIETSPDPEQRAKEILKGILPNSFIYQLMVWILGTVIVVSLLGTIVLVALDKDIPEIALALGSAAIGAIAGALVPQKSQE